MFVLLIYLNEESNFYFSIWCALSPLFSCPTVSASIFLCWWQMHVRGNICLLVACALSECCWQDRLPGRTFTFWKWIWANLCVVKNLVRNEWRAEYVHCTTLSLTLSLFVSYYKQACNQPSHDGEVVFLKLWTPSFPSPTLPLPLSFLPLRTRPLKSSQGVWGVQ